VQNPDRRFKNERSHGDNVVVTQLATSASLLGKAMKHSSPSNRLLELMPKLPLVTRYDTMRVAIEVLRGEFEQLSILQRFHLMY